MGESVRQLGKCNQMVGRGAVMWSCALGVGHAGPHFAHEFAPSVAARKAWESQHPSGFKTAKQQTLWGTAEEAKMTAPQSDAVVAPVSALDEFQGRPQTFWERNGVGDEFPAPGASPERERPVVPTAIIPPPVQSFPGVEDVVVGEALADPQPERLPEPDVAPGSSGDEVCVFMLNYTIGYLYEAADAIQRGDVGEAIEMVRGAGATLGALPSLLEGSR